MDWPYSAGALASTANDMAKWVARPDGKVVSPASQSQMWSPTKLADGGKRPYGFGWQTGEHRGKRTVSHGGGIEGFSTMVLLFPEDRVGVVVLMNSDRTNPGASPRTSPGWLTRRWHGWSRRPSRTRTRRRRAPARRPRPRRRRNPGRQKVLAGAVAGDLGGAEGEAGRGQVAGEAPEARTAGAGGERRHRPPLQVPGRLRTPHDADPLPP